MKKCIGGNGQDTTAAVQSYLASNRQLLMRNLYLIGHAEDPYAIWLTDHESDLTWSYYDTPFLHAAVTRGTVSTKIGFDATSVDLTWAPKTPRTFGVTTATANPMQLAMLGFYDNWPVRIWTVFMPTPGDANTLGACELFGGLLGNRSVDRDGIKWTVNSYLYVLDTKVPPNQIEMTNTLASFQGAIPPAGLTVVPTFEVAAVGTSTTSWSAACLGPTPGQLFANNTFQNGFLVFTGGTLEGFYSAVAADFTGGGFNIFEVFSPFPWPPTAGDTFYVSVASPIDQSQTTTFKGFPFVPAPSTAI